MKSMPGRYTVVIFIFLALFPCRIQAVQETKPWKVTKSTHFIVHYHNAEDKFLDDLIDRAEDLYNKIADNLGFRRFNFWLWDNRARIYIYDDAKSFQESTGQPAWSAGCAMIKEKKISTYVNAQSFFTTVLPHELGHIIFREFVGFDNYAIPLWLDEGVACQQENFRKITAYGIVEAALKEGAIMGIEQLCAFNPAKEPDTGRINLFYAQSVFIVDYLVREFGSDSFVSFCQKLRDKKDLQVALRSTYPFSSLKELEKGWLNYLER